ncbi:MAG: transaldolase [Deltaproteobacteria bacterium SG8_13]|nr:MAG: transaldolase [Deltaproteobacteria bacterium SG8_13]
MKATQQLHELGQSLWLDGISRDLLNSGILKRYMEEWSVAGLTSNLAVYADTVRNTSAYDAAIRNKLKEEKLGQDLFFEIALEDLRHAADLLRPVYDQTDGVNGWVSLEVSPLVIHDAAAILAEARDLTDRARRPNLFIAIPGTGEGMAAVEEAIFAGIPVNVTLLFSREHYLAAADAFLRGIERRIASGLTSNVGSVASVLVNSWNASVTGGVHDELRNQIGIAVARRTYSAYRQLLGSQRWQRACNVGTRPQRLLWAGTATVNPEISDAFYVSSLAAPLTITSMPDATLKAFADHGDLVAAMPTDGGDCEAVFARLVQAGIDVDALAVRLQTEGVEAQVKSWFELMTAIACKSAALVSNHHVDPEQEAEA